MKRYGYHRTSTREQHLDRGIKEINDYCNANDLELEKIYTDQQTGKNFNRPRYTIMKEDVQKIERSLQKEMKEIEKSLREDNNSIRLLLENEICVNIQRIAEGHLDLARNLKEAQKPSQELEVLTLKVNKLEREVGEIKKKIS